MVELYKKISIVDCKKYITIGWSIFFTILEKYKLNCKQPE